VLLELEHPPQRGSHRQVLVLIPAHNEESGIAATLESVRAQFAVRPTGGRGVRQLPPTRRPDCLRGTTDWMPGDRRQHAQEAGALNQRWPPSCPTCTTRWCCVMDADTEIDPDSSPTRGLRRPRVAAVGGTFRGQEGRRLRGYVQRNEYARTAAERAPATRQALVLTGTATLFSVPDCATCRIPRGRWLPGKANELYTRTR